MKPILLNIFLIISEYSFSQITIKNTSLLNQDTNVLYHKTNNWLQISGINGKINLVSKVGNEISSYDKNRFLVLPSSLKNDTLLVLSGKKIVFKKVFSIDTLSNLIVQLGNIKKDTASVAEILANRGLIVRLSRSLYYFPIRIISFDLTLIKPGADTVFTNGHTIGNLITSDQEILIRRLVPNSKLVFHEVVIVSASSRNRSLPGFTLITK